MALITDALFLADMGIPVFPLHTPVLGFGRGIGPCSCNKMDCGKQAGKHPRLRHGLSEASADPWQVREWWTRWPDANIGLATGYAAGIWVLDIDNGTPAGPWLWQIQQGNGDLPRTAFVRTGSGGRHWYWRLDADVLAWLDANALDLPSRNGANGMKGRDVKAVGGYVIAPPSLHRCGDRYEWLDTRAPEYAPEWLVHEVARPREVVRPYVAPPVIAGDSRERKFGMAVLRRRCEAAATSSGDARHDTIRASARVVGGVVASGYVGREEAEEALLAAGLACGRPAREVRRTVRWGLDSGMNSPIVCGERR